MDSINASLHEFSLPQSSTNLIPHKFVWPNNHISNQEEELNEHLVDLEGFINGDKEATCRITDLVRSACLTHGVFQVVNHGVDMKLVDSVHDHVTKFFNLPIDEKMRVKRLPGNLWGYSFAHADRFSSNLPWKETFSCLFHGNGPDSDATAFFKSAFGQEEYEQIE